MCETSGEDVNDRISLTVSPRAGEAPAVSSGIPAIDGNKETRNVLPHAITPTRLVEHVCLDRRGYVFMLNL